MTLYADYPIQARLYMLLITSLQQLPVAIQTASIGIPCRGSLAEYTYLQRTGKQTIVSNQRHSSPPIPRMEIRSKSCE